MWEPFGHELLNFLPVPWFNQDVDRDVEEMTNGSKRTRGKFKFYDLVVYYIFNLVLRSLQEEVLEWDAQDVHMF